MFDKLKAKLSKSHGDKNEAIAQDQEQAKAYHHPLHHAHDPVHASINVPLAADDMFLTTAMVTEDPLMDPRYQKTGMTQPPQAPDENGLIQGMEHLSVGDNQRQRDALLKGVNPVLSLKCGPLLRFIDIQERSRWLGSVMAVAIDAESDYSQRPTLKLSSGGEVAGEVIHTQFGASFWRWSLDIPLQQQEQTITYTINNSEPVEFVVPGANQDMRLMFHSCNGFSLSIDQTKFCGPDPLWRDVLREHKSKPFHVMLGGGDQIYCDLISKRCALFQQWLNMSVIEHKTAKPFTDDMRHELESFYFEHYCWWFRQGQFGRANRSIPMLNICDDHDIIDGFGSYPDHFMRSPVFSGLGNCAFKFYMLFQHQSPLSEPENANPAWCLGVQPGPYIREYARNVVCNFGPKTLFLGFDNRAERTKEKIVTDETYNKVFDRLHRQVVVGQTEHLIILLGVPIAYPRLVWLEELLTSKAMSPLKILGKTGVLPGMTQKFDEGIEILDDLNDHWTAKHHKKERNDFIHRLQDFAQKHSVRVSLLGGDVHLGSIGEFYSRESLNISRPRDHRYIANIISSAIVNAPPAEAVSNILSKRNKIHHLDDDCDEHQVPLFVHDVDGKKLNNPALLPRRNWCSIDVLPSGTTYETTPTAMSREEKIGCDASPLKVSINIEIDSTDREGRTKGYVYMVPSLDLVPHGGKISGQTFAAPQQIANPAAVPQQVHLAAPTVGTHSGLAPAIPTAQPLQNAP
ncbi:hypothetical protein PYCC9005_000609 [Savitreella phatthalungensis]